MESTKTQSLCSVLIVDDDKVMLELYRRILEEEGDFRAAPALSRSEAIEWLRHNGSPDLILLDCRMSGMSNEDFKKTVEEVTQESGTPRIIGFSSFSENSSFAKEMRSLFGEFFEKPNELQKFIDLVRKFCSEVKGAQRS
jgi:DNA-binding NtrC family response regulator